MGKIIDYIIFFSGTFVGGIVVYFARILFEHHLALSRSIDAIRITAFNNAAAKFRASFVDFIYDINHTKITDGDRGWYTVRNKINTGKFFKLHEKARILFEFHISGRDRKGFDEAWANYSRWTDDFENQNDDKDKRPEILGHIKALLKYAESK